MAMAVLLAGSSCGSPEHATPPGDPPITIRSIRIVGDLLREKGQVVRSRPGRAPTLDRFVMRDVRDVRRALVMPPPSAVAYDVTVPPSGRLRFATALTGDGASDVTVRFRVRIDGVVGYERVVRPTGLPRAHRWTAGDLVLPPRAGDSARVVLETDVLGAEQGAVRPAWSRVQLVEELHVPLQRSSPEAPNVLLLVVDTLRADRIAAYGASPSLTPHLDRLAAEGTVFASAWAQAPWTLPSVASLFTGRYPPAHGLVGRSRRFGGTSAARGLGATAYLPDAVPTMATMARDAGIATVAVTSNLLLARENNLAHGFDTFTALPMRGQPPQWARAAAVHATFDRWLETRADARFFAYLHYMEPHDPYVASSPRLATCPPSAGAGVCDGLIRLVAREREEGGRLPSPEEIAYLERRYDAEVRAWDAALPGLLSMLAARGLTDRTVIIVTADHGEEFAEHGQLGHRKQLYRESLAIPLVLYGPGVPRVRRSDVAELVDLLPTVGGILGGRVPPRLPGRDLRRPPSRPATTFAETRYGTGRPGERNRHLQSIRTADWLLVRDAGSARIELYDRRSDPAEQRLVETGAEAIVGQLTAALDGWQTRNRVRREAGGLEVDLSEQLQALGYFE